MKNAIAIIGLLLTYNVAIAQVVQVDKPIVCAPANQVFQSLISDFGEQPVMFGKNESENNSLILIFINSFKKTFTLVESNGKIACILSTGKDVVFKPTSTKPVL